MLLAISSLRKNGGTQIRIGMSQDTIDAYAESYKSGANIPPVVAFFESGGSLKIPAEASSADVIAQLSRVPELLDHISAVGASSADPVPVVASAGEFILEGLYAQKKIGRRDDRGFVTPERRTDVDVDMERLERLRRMKKQVN